MDHQAFAQLLGNYGEFVGAIAVVATLFYLAVQVRHGKEATEANIWSGGRIYRVSVKPHGRDARLVDGQPVVTRSYSLRGVGEPLWRGRLDLVLAEDEAATPLEIAVSRDGMRVRLELVEPDS